MPTQTTRLLSFELSPHSLGHILTSVTLHNLQPGGHAVLLGDLTHEEYSHELPTFHRPCFRAIHARPPPVYPGHQRFFPVKNYLLPFEDTLMIEQGIVLRTTIVDPNESREIYHITVTSVDDRISRFIQDNWGNVLPHFPTICQDKINELVYRIKRIL